MGRLLVEPDAGLAQRLGLPPTRFRIEAAALDTVRVEGEMHLDALVDAWAQVLATDKDLRVVEGPIVALWANHVASQRGTAGDADGAAHYARLGLQFAPTNLSLQARLGLALLGQGELAQALVQFRRVMDDPRAGFSPTLWLAAGRTAMGLGLHADAVCILEEMAAYLPDDAAFWDLLGHAREQAGLPPARPRASWQAVDGPEWKAAPDPAWEPV